MRSKDGDALTPDDGGAGRGTIGGASGVGVGRDPAFGAVGLGRAEKGGVFILDAGTVNRGVADGASAACIRRTVSVNRSAYEEILHRAALSREAGRKTMCSSWPQRCRLWSCRRPVWCRYRPCCRRRTSRVEESLPPTTKPLAQWWRHYRDIYERTFVHPGCSRLTTKMPIIHLR